MYNLCVGRVQPGGDPGVRTGILQVRRSVCVPSFICEILAGMPWLQVRATGIYNPALRYLRLQKHWQDTQNQPLLHLSPQTPTKIYLWD